MLTHLPVLGVPFAVSLFVVALWRQSSELKKVALGILVVTALVAVPAYLTGEPTEHRIEALPGVSEAAAEQHEDAALAAFVGVIIVGAAALGGLVLFRGGRALPRWFAISILTAAIVVSGLMAWTANLGGQIRHSEIRAGGAAGAPVKQHHDDD